MRILLSLAILCGISAPALAHKTINTDPGTGTAPLAQNKDQKEEQLEKIVQQVEADYAAINAKKLNIRIIKVDEGAFAEGCANTANVTFYTPTGGKPEKIERWLAADATEEMVEYYYKAGKLIFVHRKQVYYPPAAGADAVQAELKIYLDQGKPVKYISSQGDTYQTMDFAAEVKEAKALFQAVTNDQVRDAICPAEQ